MEKKKSITSALIIISLIVSIAFSIIIVYSQHLSQHKQLNSLMNRQATQMTNSVEMALTEVYGVQSLIIGSNGEDINLEKIGGFLIHDEFKDFVKNILIAPDGIVEQVYPLKGNESVLGLNLYSKDNASNQDAIKARDSNKIVVTGPYNLVQGGQAISGRVSVHLPQDDGSVKNWGIVSITLSFPAVMENTATNILEEFGYAYRVLKLEEDNEFYEVLNHDFTTNNDCETITFRIYSMVFSIESYPKNGWINPLFTAEIFVIMFISLLVISLMGRIIFNKRTSLRERATIDSLTEIFNRAAGENKINSFLKSKDFKVGVFILIDIDYFKNVNDELGHQMGDEVLRETAKIYLLLFKSTDIVCRLGGDEFIVFLTHNNSREFLESKINQLLNAMYRNIVFEKKSVKISSSIGISFAPEDGMTFDELYKCADKALYYSKKHGRNQATIYQEIENQLS